MNKMYLPARHSPWRISVLAWTAFSVKPIGFQARTVTRISWSQKQTWLVVTANFRGKTCCRWGIKLIIPTQKASTFIIDSSMSDHVCLNFIFYNAFYCRWKILSQFQALLKILIILFSDHNSKINYFRFFFLYFDRYLCAQA